MTIIALDYRPNFAFQGREMHGLFSYDDSSIQFKSTFRPTPNDNWGDITRVDIAVDPPQFESSGRRKDDISGFDTNE